MGILPADLDQYREEVGRHRRVPGPEADERFAHLFAAEEARELIRMAGAAGGGTAERRLRALARYAADGLLRRACAEETAEAARRLAGPLALPVGETPLGLADRALAAEPEAPRRREIQAARLRALENRLGTLLRDARERRVEAAREAGAPSPEALLAEAAGLDLEAAAAQARALLHESEDPGRRLLEAALRDAVGLGLDEADAADLPRAGLAPQLEGRLPAGGAAAAVGRALELLEIDPARAPAPPGPPAPGLAGYAGALRALGMGLAAAGASPRLAPESRLLGDPALALGSGFLLEGLVADPEWLRRALGLDEPAAAARAGAAARLVTARLGAARVLALAGADPVGSASEALGLPWPEALALADPLAGLLPVDELRGRLLAGALGLHLRERLGPRWFADPAAGRLLGEIWIEGGELDPEGLARELGPGLDPALPAAEAAALA